MDLSLGVTQAMCVIPGKHMVSEKSTAGKPNLAAWWQGYGEEECLG